jgi:NTE family protein
MRLLLLVLLAALALSAAPRKKIAVALEGGSALGIAHIGVLEWLEQHRIPVDYIAGTSMGGLVGGLYATGRSPAELRAIVKDAPWDKLLGGAIAFRDLSFRRREDRTAVPNLLELGLKGGVSLPSGLNLGHEIGLLLSRWTLAYPELDSFDDLPTPFRCVATNLVSGEEEVFGKGVLADALRATMSLPGVFKPASRGGQLYVDGAVLQNLPVDVARQMGADLVIAVHLAKPPIDPKTLNSFPGVIDRSIGIVVSANEMRMMERADIVVTVDLAGFNASDYPKSAELADAGHAATARKQNILETFALPEAEWAEFQRARAARRRPEPTQVSTLKVEAEDPRQARLVTDTLTPLTARPWDPALLERELSRAVGTGRLASLRYSVRGSELLVQAEQRSYAPPFLLPLLEIDGSDIENFRVSAGARLTWMGVGTPRAEWRNDIIVGSRYRFASEYWVPLGERTRFFAAARAFAGDAAFPLYQGRAQVANYRLRDTGAGAELGYQLGRSAELRAGFTTTWYAARRRIGSPVLPNVKDQLNVPGLRFRLLDYDDPIVPREGSRVEASFAYVLTRGPQAELQANRFFRVSANASVFAAAAGGTAFDTQSLDFGSFSLGGPLRLPAYAVNELLGHQYWLGTAGYLREFRPGLSILGTRLYGATWAQIGKMYGQPGYPGVAASAAGAMILRTFIGPVFLGGAWGDRGHGRAFVGVGRFF